MNKNGKHTSYCKANRMFNRGLGEFYEKKVEEGTYKDGKKDGLWTRFSEQGSKENQMVYNQSKYDYIYLDNGIVSAIQE